MYAIVDLVAEAVVRQQGATDLTFNNLKRVALPDDDKSVIFNPAASYIFPPESLSPTYKLFQVTEVESGSGVVATVSDPVYDSGAGTVTVTTTLRDKTDKEISDEKDQQATDIMIEHGLIAVLKCINDGSIVPGGEVSFGALKTAIKAQL
jgi:hypothetical protein